MIKIALNFKLHFLRSTRKMMVSKDASIGGVKTMLFRFITIAALFASLSACAARNLASPETTFSPKSETALIIGGGTGVKSLFGGCKCPIFVRADPVTEVPNGGRVSFHSHGDNPRAFVAPAGHYVMAAWDDCTRMYHTPGPNRVIGMFADRSKNSYKDASTFRFNAKPGEILYIGHFTGYNFEDRSDDAKTLLGTMPNVSGNFVFRPATRASSFSATD